MQIKNQGRMVLQGDREVDSFESQALQSATATLTNYKG